MDQYWDMTPLETRAVIAANTRRAEMDQRDLGWLAWHIAALSRAKKLPPLSQLFVSDKPKKLKGEELEKRREEFRRMKEKWNAKVPTR